MIITCPECHTQYRLDPRLLGADGREVKCTSCKNVWIQKHVAEKDIMQVLSEAGVVEEEIARAPETVAETAPPEPQPQTFEAVLRQTAAAVVTTAQIPDAVKPSFKAPVPAVYRPMGIGPAQFGFLTFLLCTFVSLSLMFLAREPLVRLLPSTALLYKSLGFDIKAPGEGLRISELVAENRIDKTGRSLTVEARLANMTEAALPHPPVRVTLSSAYGAVLKEWILDGQGAKPLAPGETVTLKSEFRDAPEGGADIGLKVIEP